VGHAVSLANGNRRAPGHWGGFELLAGQGFDLLDWGSASGSFDHVDGSGPGPAAGLALDGSIGITAVPAPGSWALMLAGIGLGGCPCNRRHKKSGMSAASAVRAGTPVP